MAPFTARELQSLMIQSAPTSMSLSFVSVLCTARTRAPAAFPEQTPADGVLDDDAVLRSKTKQGSSLQVRFGIAACRW